MIYLTTGEKIGILAKEKGINIHKLSVMIGISYDTLYSIVKRKSKKVDVKIIDRIAEVLNVGYRFEGEEIIFYPFVDTIETATSSTINSSQGMISNSDKENNTENLNEFELQLFASNTFARDKIISQLDLLNEKGQQKALEQIELLTKIQEYLK